jgi:hypothetical protein
MATRRFFAAKANFDPNQPRVPTGNPDGGQWTNLGRHDIRVELAVDGVPDVSAQILSDASPDPIQPGAQFAQNAPAITTDTSALTGISRIDETTNKLVKTLSRVMDSLSFIPQQFGPAYGTAMHVAFATELRALNLEGIGTEGVEQSFDASGVAKYGVPGSIRTDVVLRNEVGDIVAIYDVKTGGAVLRPSRAAELRAKTQAGPEVPVVELHFERGASLKHEPIEKDSWSDCTPGAWSCPLQGHARRGANRTYSARLRN